jgi:hypothetical protein
MDAIVKCNLEHSLVELWFHSFTNDKNHPFEWQGRVVKEERPGVYLVQLFEWIEGYASELKVVELSDMKGWVFYKTNEEMNFAYRRFYGMGPDADGVTALDVDHMREPTLERLESVAPVIL